MLSQTNTKRVAGSLLAVLAIVAVAVSFPKLMEYAESILAADPSQSTIRSESNNNAEQMFSFEMEGNSSNNYAGILYAGADSRVDVNFCTSATACTESATANEITGIGADNATIAFDPDTGYGRYLVHFSGSTSIDLIECTNADCSSRTTHSGIITQNNATNSYPRMKINASGNPVITYVNLNASYELKLLICDDATCTSGTTRTLDSSVNTGNGFNDLELNSNDYPVVVYKASNSYAKYVQCDNASCSTVNGGSSVGTSQQQVFYVGNQYVKKIDMELTGTDQPLMIHDYFTQPRLIVCTGSSSNYCSSYEYGNAIDNNARGYSMELDPNDNYNPRLTYYDTVDDALKFVRCGNFKCDRKTVIDLPTDGSPANDGGHSNDLVLINSTIYIAYFDDNNDEVEYIYCDSTSCGAAQPNQAPSAPTNLLTDGVENNSDVTNTSFSHTMTYNDPDGDAATKFQIQVSTTSTITGDSFDDYVYRSSTSNGETITTTLNDGGSYSIPNRTTIKEEQTLYWRVRFHDSFGPGTWSAVQQYTIGSGLLPHIVTIQAGGDQAVDCDGDTTAGVGTCTATNGSSLQSLTQAHGVCADSLTAPTIVYIDSDNDCDATDGSTQTYLINTAGGTASDQFAAFNWRYHDANTNFSYDLGEDIIYNPNATNGNPGSTFDSVIDAEFASIVITKHNTTSVYDDDMPKLVFFNNDSKQVNYLMCGSFDCSLGVPFRLSPSSSNEGDEHGNYLSASVIDNFGSFVSTMVYRDDTNDKMLYLICDSPDSCNFGGQSESDFDTTTGAGYYSSITENSSGHPRAAYAVNNGGGDYDLKISQCTDSGCFTRNTSTPDSTGVTGIGTAVAVGSDSKLRVAYLKQDTGTTGTVKYIICDSTSDCDTPTLTKVVPGTETGTIANPERAIDMILDSNNRPTISYYDDDANKLMLTRCFQNDCSSDTDWTTDATQSAVINEMVSGFGAQHRMIKNGSGFPLIVYQGSLEYINCADADCSVSTSNTVDNTATSGSMMDVALDGNNNPRFVYADTNTGSLKLATCSNTDCGASNTAPSAPSNLYSNTETTKAETGLTNPTTLGSLDVVFSAIYNDPDSGDTATSYQMQIDDGNNDFSSIATNCDSGKTTFASQSLDNVTDGNRTGDGTGGTREDIVLPTNCSIQYETTYYWRIKFWDDDDAEGTYSPDGASAAYFFVPDVTAPSIDSSTVEVSNSSTPASGASNVDLDTDITIVISDDTTNNATTTVDSSTLDVTIGGILAIDNGACQTGYSCTITPSGSPSGKTQTVVINPNADLNPGTAYTVQVLVDDTATATNTLNTNFNFTTIGGPSAPTSLFSNTAAEGAQSGLSNPTLASTSVVVSAIHNDNASLSANGYRVQVATDNTFSSIVYDSGSGATLLTSSLADGVRSQNINISTTLNDNTTYYWRLRFFNSIGAGDFSPSNTSAASFTIDLNDAPVASGLYSNITSVGAQSGETDPLTLTSTNVVFSALNSDPDSGDIVNNYQLQINDENNFTGEVLCEGAKTSIANIVSGNRSPDIGLASGCTINYDTQYYWRIKFWDDENTEGEYSDVATFKVPDLTAPVITITSVSDGDVNVAPESNIVFTVTDGESGVENSFDISIGGVNYMVDGTCISTIADCIVTEITNGYQVTINPISILPASRALELVVNVDDLSTNNNQTIETLNFTTAFGVAPRSTTSRNTGSGSGGGGGAGSASGGSTFESAILDEASSLIPEDMVVGADEAALTEEETALLEELGLSEEEISEIAGPHLSEEDIAALEEAGFTSEEIVVIEEALVDAALEAALEEAGLTEEEIAALDEGVLSPEEEAMLEDAGLTPEEIDAIEDGLLTDEEKALLEDAGMTEEEIDALEEELIAEEIAKDLADGELSEELAAALAEEGMTDAEIEALATVDDVLTPEQEAVLEELGLTDEEIASVEDALLEKDAQDAMDAAQAEEEAQSDSVLDKEQEEKLKDAGYTDEDIAAIEEGLLTDEEEAMLEDAGFTEEEIEEIADALIVDEIEEAILADEPFSEELKKALEEAGFTEEEIEALQDDILTEDEKAKLEELLGMTEEEVADLEQLIEDEVAAMPIDEEAPSCPAPLMFTGAYPTETTINLTWSGGNIPGITDQVLTVQKKDEPGFEVPITPYPKTALLYELDPCSEYTITIRNEAANGSICELSSDEIVVQTRGDETCAAPVEVDDRVVGDPADLPTTDAGAGAGSPGSGAGDGGGPTDGLTVDPATFFPGFGGGSGTGDSDNTGDALGAGLSGGGTGIGAPSAQGGDLGGGDTGASEDKECEIPEIPEQKITPPKKVITYIPQPPLDICVDVTDTFHFCVRAPMPPLELINWIPGSITTFGLDGCSITSEITDFDPETAETEKIVLTEDPLQKTIKEGILEGEELDAFVCETYKSRARALSGVYEDVAGTPIEGYAAVLLENGVILSADRDAFDPKTRVRRSEVLRVAMIANCGRFDLDVEIEPPFPDVLESHPDVIFVQSAKNEGIVSGYLHDGLYRPDIYISRAEVLKIVMEVVLGDLFPEFNGPSEPFVDVEDYMWFENYIKFAYQVGLAADTENHKYYPFEKANRAYIAEILAKALVLRDKIEQEGLDFEVLPVVTESDFIIDLSTGMVRGLEHPDGLRISEEYILTEEMLAYSEKFCSDLAETARAEGAILSDDINSNYRDLLLDYGVVLGEEARNNLRGTVTRSEVLRIALQSNCDSFLFSRVIKPPFPDVSTTHRDVIFIKAAKLAEIVSGYLHDGLYRPDNTISRAEVLKIVLEVVYGQEVDKITGSIEPYADVDSSQWFHPYVAFAYEKGILQAAEGAVFQPGDLATRQFIVDILLSALEKA